MTTAPLRIATTVLVASALASCVEIRPTPGVLFAADPAGARVVSEGKDSGFVTPGHIALERERHDVDLVLDGYHPSSIRIEEGGQVWLILWDEAWVNEQTWRFPLWLNARDGIFPVKVDRGYSPERVHVSLRLVEGQDRPRRGERGERGERPEGERAERPEGGRSRR
jgi:hypothetical protein